MELYRFNVYHDDCHNNNNLLQILNIKTVPKKHPNMPKSFQLFKDFKSKALPEKNVAEMMNEVYLSRSQNRLNRVTIVS